MLKKLIKHEWRSVWKILGGVNLFLLLYTLAGIISFHSSIWNSSNKIIESLLLLASMFYFLAIMVISFTVIIYITVRFYRNIYSDEGYLMHTLPVSQKGLILSKLLVAFLWTIITGVVIFVSIVSVVATVLSIAEGMRISQLWDALCKMIASNSIWFKETFGISVFHGIILALIGGIVSIFQEILTIYAAISLGQLLQKHKILGSFLGYIGINTILQILNSIVIAPIMLNMPFNITISDAGQIILPYYYFALGESIILCILFFFLTEYLMTKKLNLD